MRELQSGYHQVFVQILGHLMTDNVFTISKLIRAIDNVRTFYYKKMNKHALLPFMDVISLSYLQANM
jgi:hypothetical protein